MSQLLSIHNAELERNDAFYEVKKERVDKEQWETYNAMLPRREA